MPMQIDSTAKKLLFCTVRVDTVLEDGSEGSGTAFVVNHPTPRGIAQFVVTNRHIVEGVRRGGLVFTQMKNGRPVFGQRFLLNIDEFPHAWFLHPDADTDLALVPFAPLREAAREQGVELYVEPIDSRTIPDLASWQQFDALEDILFVGYPSGVWDQVNLMPILRRGTTATPLALDFEGQRQFLVDAAVYPGSSGSPVFIERRDFSRSRLEGERTLSFAGVIAAVFFREEAHHLVPAPVPANNRGMMMGTEMIDLGLVIKSDQVIGMIDAYLRRWQA
jgi:hypothetical protein